MNFIKQWHKLLEELVSQKSVVKENSDYYYRDSWLHEIVLRTQGHAGLATLARSSKRIADLRAWCCALVADKNWQQAFSAYDKAAKIVAKKLHMPPPLPSYLYDQEENSIVNAYGKLPRWQGTGSTRTWA